MLAAACDTRISVAVPGCYFNTFSGSIGSIIHCDCNYVTTCPESCATARCTSSPA